MKAKQQLQVELESKVNLKHASALRPGWQRQTGSLDGVGCQFHRQWHTEESEE
jgi:hypothetical protein